LAEIIKKVKRQQPRLLTFVENAGGGASHNNYAEYLIRVGILKRKISGGSVSAADGESGLTRRHGPQRVRADKPPFLKPVRTYKTTGPLKIWPPVRLPH